jgi:hypothetical protein
MRRITLISFLFVFPLIKVFCQSSSTASICVNIIDAVGTSKLKDFDFVSLNSKGENSTLEIKAGESKKDNVNVNSFIGTDNGMALFSVRNNNMAYSVTLPRSVTITKNNSKERMIAGSFNFKIIDSNNSSFQILAIRATLYTCCCQGSGQYVAVTPLTITLNYN